MKIQLEETHNLAGLIDWMNQQKISKERKTRILEALNQNGVAKIKEGYYFEQTVEEGFKTIKRYLVLEVA